MKYLSNLILKAMQMIGLCKWRYLPTSNNTYFKHECKNILDFVVFTRKIIAL